VTQQAMHLSFTRIIITATITDGIDGVVGMDTDIAGVAITAACIAIDKLG
jgi:hypothetical protein